MSSYFDKKQSELFKLRDKARASGAMPYDELDAWEEQLVWDVTLVATLPQLPAEHADAIHQAIVRHGVQSQPNQRPRDDIETDDQHLASLHTLQSRLHDVFHGIGRIGREAPDGHPNVGFNDNPLDVVRWFLFEPGEQRRERLAAQAQQAAAEGRSS